MQFACDAVSCEARRSGLLRSNYRARAGYGEQRTRGAVRWGGGGGEGGRQGEPPCRTSPPQACSPPQAPFVSVNWFIVRRYWQWNGEDLFLSVKAAIAYWIPCKGHHGQWNNYTHCCPFLEFQELLLNHAHHLGTHVLCIRHKNTCFQRKI